MLMIAPEICDYYYYIHSIILLPLYNFCLSGTSIIFEFNTLLVVLHCPASINNSVSLVDSTVDVEQWLAAAI